MKKWVTGFILCLVMVAGVYIYLFIPNTTKVENKTGIKATRAGLYRMLLDKKNVAAWWPGKIKNDSFYYNNLSYTFNNNSITVLPVSIQGKNTDVYSSLFLLEVAKDSTQLNWETSFALTYNPFTRLPAYFKAKKLQDDMQVILRSMESFYKYPKNIYGVDIHSELVTDSFLIATSELCNGYPTTKFIYSLIDKLKNFAATNAANVSGFPMLNIGTADSVSFDVKVAMPVDKLLASSGEIAQKRMLGRGNILVAVVTGGNAITNSAFEQVQKYKDDYQRVSPAIPFYSLITDRLKEPDSSKWITKIYFPVM